MNTAIGIMTHRIRRPESFRRDVKEARSVGFDGLFAFTPQDVDLGKKRISAYEWTEQGWVRTIRNYPPIAIDIGYYTKPSIQQKVRQIRHPKHIPFTGYGLGNKWSVQETLANCETVSPLLIPAIQLAKAADALTFVKDCQSAVVKPLKSSWSQEHIRVTHHNGLYLVKEHRKLELKYSPARFQDLLNQWKMKQAWLVQAWLPLDQAEGKPYELRILMQKNGEGRWERTASAVRERLPSAASKPYAADREHLFQPLPFLRNRFGEAKALALVRQAERAADVIPPFLEQAYDRRLADLGLDFAIESSGKLRLLEVGVKPDRGFVRRLHGKDAAEDSRRLPFLYAAYLCRKLNDQTID